MTAETGWAEKGKTPEPRPHGARPRRIKVPRLRSFSANPFSALRLFSLHDLQRPRDTTAFSHLCPCGVSRLPPDDVAHPHSPPTSLEAKKCGVKNPSAMPASFTRHLFAKMIGGLGFNSPATDSFAMGLVLVPGFLLPQIQKDHRWPDSGVCICGLSESVGGPVFSIGSWDRPPDHQLAQNKPADLS